LLRLALQHTERLKKVLPDWGEKIFTQFQSSNYFTKFETENNKITEIYDRQRSRYLTLVNWMTKTLGRIIEKEISSPDIYCRNVQFEIELLNITHTWCSSVFDRSLNKAIRQNPSITQYELWKNVC